MIKIRRSIVSKAVDVWKGNAF